MGSIEHMEHSALTERKGHQILRFRSDSFLPSLNYQYLLSSNIFWKLKDWPTRRKVSFSHQYQ